MAARDSARDAAVTSSAASTVAASSATAAAAALRRPDQVTVVSAVTASWAAASSTSPAVSAPGHGSGSLDPLRIGHRRGRWLRPPSPRARRRPHRPGPGRLPRMPPPGGDLGPTTSPVSEVRKPSPISVPPVSAIAPKAGGPVCPRAGRAVPGWRESASACASAGSRLSRQLARRRPDRRSRRERPLPGASRNPRHHRWPAVRWCRPGF